MLRSAALFLLSSRRGGRAGIAVISVSAAHGLAEGFTDFLLGLLFGLELLEGFKLGAAEDTLGHVNGGVGDGGRGTANGSTANAGYEIHTTTETSSAAATRTGLGDYGYVTRNSSSAGRCVSNWGGLAEDF